MSAPERNPFDYFHLAVIYIVWGSVYLAIKIGIDGENTFAPFQLQAVRLCIGGLALAAVAFVWRDYKGIGVRELWLCLVSAALFWIGGNGFAIIALSEMPSSFVAMAMGTIPLWSVLYQALMERSLPRAPIAVAAGFFGLVLIFWPTLSREGPMADVTVWGVAALLGAPVTWIVATGMQPALLARADGMAIAAIQLLMGSGLALVITLFQGAPWPETPGAPAIIALLYIALFGSALSFASYLKASTLFSRPVVAAFAYVNPIVGLILGWWLLDERPAAISLVGMAVVTLAVIVTLAGEARPARKNSRKTQEAH